MILETFQILHVESASLNVNTGKDEHCAVFKNFPWTQS